MVVARVFLLLCVAAAIVQSEGPGIGVNGELVSLPLRHLMEDVVKVHVIVHKTEKEHHKKEEEEHKGAPRSSEAVSDDSLEAVRIKEAAEKHGKAHHEKNTVKPIQDDETVVEYKHGSVKIFGKKDSMAVESTAGIATKDATAKEKEVASTANEVHEVSTKLSSTPSADKKSFHDTFGPMVIICGIIGGLAAIIGVAGLVMDHSQSIKDSSGPDDSAELDVDVDIEANIVPVEVEGDGSDSDCDEDEEEDYSANRTAHVSV